MSFGKPAVPTNGERTSHVSDRDQKQAAKHTLLASAANQNYQRCYRALKSLEKYWAGVKYILTVLDQKAKGVGDPLLYTREEMESALEVPRPEPSFTSPGWRRKLSWGTYLTEQSMDVDAAKVSAAMRKGTRTPIPGSPMNPSQGTILALPMQTFTNTRVAIGWSLTGTMNSPSTNVAVMYTSDSNNTRDTKPLQPKPTTSGTSRPSIASVLSNPTTKFDPSQPLPSPASFPAFDPTTMPPPPTQGLNAVPTPDPVLVSDADLLLNLHSPFSTSSPGGTTRPTPLQPTSFARGSAPSSNPAPTQQQPSDFSPGFSTYPTPSDQPFGDMVIDSQDVDMSVLGTDMMPWDLEYLPHDMLYFGDAPFGVGDLGDNVGSGAQHEG